MQTRRAEAVPELGNATESVFKLCRCVRINLDHLGQQISPEQLRASKLLRLTGWVCNRIATYPGAISCGGGETAMCIHCVHTREGGMASLISRGHPKANARTIRGDGALGSGR